MAACTSVEKLRKDNKSLITENEKIKVISQPKVIWIYLCPSGEVDNFKPNNKDDAILIICLKIYLNIDALMISPFPILLCFGCFGDN
jgi:hypothetical protein